MPPQLLALTDGPSILLDKPILLLGRHQECDIQLVSRKVSRRHCCIAQVSDYLVVRDLGSTNGIRINGVRVLEGNLKPGDELTIGNYRYQVRWDALGAGPLPRPARATAREPAFARPPVLDDAMLESCDEPVPLSEPAPKTEPRRPGDSIPPAPGGANLASVADEADKSELAPHDRSLVLPEQIELAPISDVLPSHRDQPPP